MTFLKFILPYKPKPQPRPRIVKGRRAYYPKSFEEWRKGLEVLIVDQWNKMGRLRVEGQIKMCLHFYGRKNGDIDNYVKSVLDALQTVLKFDDKQVYELHADWREENYDGIEIIIQKK